MGAVARVCRKCTLQLYATVVNLLIVQDRNISYGGIIRFRFYGYNLSSTIHAAPLISCLVRPQNYTKSRNGKGNVIKNIYQKQKLSVKVL